MLTGREGRRRSGNSENRRWRSRRAAQKFFVKLAGKEKLAAIGRLTAFSAVTEFCSSTFDRAVMN